MIKTIDITGIKLDNYTMRESIMHLEKSMSQNLFHTVEEITMDTLLLAGNDERVKEAIEKLDDTIIAENGILTAAGKNSMQRQHEIENKAFFQELMRRLERNRKKVFLLGEKEKEVEEIYAFLTEDFPRMQFAGMAAMEDCTDEQDAIINEINAATPDAVISILPSPIQEYFLLDHRDKISALLWYGIGNKKPVHKKTGFWDALKQKLRVIMLKKHITDYYEQKEDSK